MKKMRKLLYVICVVIGNSLPVNAKENDKFSFANFIGEYTLAVLKSHKKYEVENPATLTVLNNVNNLSRETNDNLALFLWLSIIHAREINDVVPLLTEKIRKNRTLEIVKILETEYIGNPVMVSNYSKEDIENATNYIKDLRAVMMSPAAK